MKLRAQLVELYTRFTKWDKATKVYSNGENNLYPYEIETVVNNSPTARRAANMMAKFIAGKGLTQDVMLDKSKNYRLSDFVMRVAKDISVHYGCFIHVSYKVNQAGEVVPNIPTVLDYTHCRIMKEDDKNNAGKIAVKDWHDRTMKQKKPRLYYPYHNNEDVVFAQIMEDAKEANKETLAEAISLYRGQVLYLNLTPEQIYALSLFDSVYNDCDTEYRISLYSNNVLRTGFLGKIAVITQGLDEEQSKIIDQDVKQWLGAENSGNVYRLDLEQTADLDKAFQIKQLDSQFDEAQFKDTKDSVRLNILGAANNIPEGLVFKSGGLFQGSGEAYKQMKLFYNEQTEYERGKIEDVLLDMGYDTKIIPLINEQTGV